MVHIAAILWKSRSADKPASARLFDDYFVWKNKSCGAVFKLYEVHDPVQITHLAQNSWPFIEARMTLAVANRPEQSAISPHNRILPVFCR
jgi:hypothetical protein